MPRLVSVLSVLLLACGGETNSGAESGSETNSDGESGSETESDGEAGDEAESDDETDSDDESGDEDPPPMDLPPEAVCEGYWDCPMGTACVKSVCVAVDEPPGCIAPVMVPLPQPSADGHVVAIDLVDLQQDGDVEILAWIDEVGVGVLDDGEWTKSTYLPAVQTQQSSIVAIHVDDDELLDVVLHDHWNDVVHVGLGDGIGGFEITTDVAGVGHLRGIQVAPDERRAFGFDSALYQAAYLRFDVVEQPVIQQLGYDSVHDLMPAQLDAGGDEDVVFGYRSSARAYAMRLRPNDVVEVAEVLVEPQGVWGWWLAADLDGDGRDDLVAREPMYYDADGDLTLLSALANTTDADVGPPSFAAREIARISGYNYVAAAGDFDGDGDDEMLFVDGPKPGASLVWASDAGLLGCMATFPDFPDGADVVHSMRTGDIDGDGDDELVLFQYNGALQVLDFQ